MKGLTIGKLAAEGGVGVETIRYYQRRGLLEQPDRDRGIRRYGSDEVRRLRFIRSAQAAGFTLEEIAELLRLDAMDDRERVQALAVHRIAALDERIAQMQAARTALIELASECSRGGAGPCPILTAFDSGAQATVAYPLSNAFDSADAQQMASAPRSLFGVCRSQSHLSFLKTASWMPSSPTRAPTVIQNAPDA